MTIRPTQKPGISKQDYATPRAFIDAVEALFGRIDADLAASASNAVVPRFLSPEQDALAASTPWQKGVLWLNPPFGRIGPWVERCAIESASDPGARRILVLTPAAIGTRWFADFVYGQARVYALRPRLCFDGRHPYPGDLMLSVYGIEPGFETWRWR